jgi:CheY-like chemotaxis protein
VSSILVVDDEVEVGRSLKRLLGRDGHDVRTARSGHEALQMLDGIELLVTDVRMPGMSGFELAAEVRRRLPAIRCCLMSGDASAEGMQSTTAFVDARIAKPFVNQDLLDLVREILR